MTEVSKSDVFAYDNFFTYFLYVFEKQVQNTLDL